MIKHFIFLAFFCAAFLTVPAAAQPDRGVGVKPKDAPAGEKRLALVIGNSNYANTPPLANPANDAADMAASLRELGFEVISGTNQTLPQMRKLIREFGARLEEQKGVGLFYFAGHGIQFGGKNFLIPVDAEIASEVETEDAGVDLNTVLRQMDAAGNGFNLVILDACRNNPFARSWRGDRDAAGAGGLARVDAPTGTLIAYATKPGAVASDGAGRNGLYTGALLKQMRVRNIDITKMFQRVRAEVIAASKGQQVPFDESSVVGDFYFAGTGEAPANGTFPGIDAAAIEKEFWNSIKDSSDVDDFRLYQKKYPQGVYADLADLKIARLQPTVTAAPPPGPVGSTGKPSSIGVVNGKATNLVRPPYPNAAKAVGATGVVNVEVIIDETGKVISAVAVTGHPLLRPAAEEAARASTFSPIFLGGQPIKVSGIVVYSFAK